MRREPFDQPSLYNDRPFAILPVESNHPPLLIIRHNNWSKDYEGSGEQAAEFTNKMTRETLAAKMAEAQRLYNAGKGKVGNAQEIGAASQIQVDLSQGISKSKEAEFDAAFVDAIRNNRGTDSQTIDNMFELFKDNA